MLVSVIIRLLTSCFIVLSRQYQMVVTDTKKQSESNLNSLVIKKIWAKLLNCNVNETKFLELNQFTFN